MISKVSWLVQEFQFSVKVKGTGNNLKPQWISFGQIKNKHMNNMSNFIDPRVICNRLDYQKPPINHNQHIHIKKYNKMMFVLDGTAQKKENFNILNVMYIIIMNVFLIATFIIIVLHYIPYK